jgi:hypothetical protein
MVENLIVFINYSNQIPIMLGMFGKENVEYLSKFDAKEFDTSDKQIYYHKKLNSKICFYRYLNDFINESNDFFKKFNKCVIFSEFLESKLVDDKLFQLNTSWPNIKKAFIWHYGEVFEKKFEVLPLNSIQGLSLLENDLLLVDEIQLISVDYMSMILSRPSKNGKLILLGDLKQTYSIVKPSESGLLKLLRILQGFLEYLEDKFNSLVDIDAELLFGFQER